MNKTKYQRAKYVRELLAQEASDHGLSMQVVLAELPETELQVLEKFASRCRTSHAPQSETQSDSQMVAWVLDFEQQLV